MKDLKKDKKCSTCVGFGLWATGNPSPMGAMDSTEMPSIKCPECGAVGKIACWKETVEKKTKNFFDYSDKVKKEIIEEAAINANKMQIETIKGSNRIKKIRPVDNNDTKQKVNTNKLCELLAESGATFTDCTLDSTTNDVIPKTKDTDWVKEFNLAADVSGMSPLDRAVCIGFIKKHIMANMPQLKEILEHNYDKVFGTYDYKGIVNEVIELVEERTT